MDDRDIYFRGVFDAAQSVIEARSRGTLSGHEWECLTSAVGFAREALATERGEEFSVERGFLVRRVTLQTGSYQRRCPRAALEAAARALAAGSPFILHSLSRRAGIPVSAAAVATAFLRRCGLVTGRAHVVAAAGFTVEGAIAAFDALAPAA